MRKNRDTREQEERRASERLHAQLHPPWPPGHMHVGEVGKRGGRHSPDSLEGKNSSSLKES